MLFLHNVRRGIGENTLLLPQNVGKREYKPSLCKYFVSIHGQHNIRARLERRTPNWMGDSEKKLNLKLNLNLNF